MNKLLVAAAAVTLALVEAASAGTLLDFSGGSEATAGLAPSVMLGFEFRLNATLAVTSLGIWDEGANGLVNSHLVRLWDSAGTLLASATLTNAASPQVSLSTNGRWLFSAIAPVEVGPGEYVLGAEYLNDDFDSVRTVDPTVYMAPEATFMNLRYGDGGSSDMPSYTAPFIGHFGPNLQFSEVPEPASLALIGALALLMPRVRARND